MAQKIEQFLRLMADLENFQNMKAEATQDGEMFEDELEFVAAAAAEYKPFPEK